METCRQACLPGTACRAPAKKHGRSISGDRQADQAGVVTFCSTSRRAGTANGGGKPPHSTRAVLMLRLWLIGNVLPSTFAGHGPPRRMPLRRHFADAIAPGDATVVGAQTRVSVPLNR